MPKKRLFAVELIVITAVFFLDWKGVLPVGKTSYLFLLGWISLGVRGLKWKDVGLRFGPEPSWSLKKLLIVGFVVGIAMEALELFATQPLLTKLLNKGPDLYQLQRLVGNTKLLILGIVLAWILAAFGEETVWRGYLLNRLADMFGRSTIGWSSAAIFV